MTTRLAPRSEDVDTALGLYLRDIGRIPLLSAREEVALTQEIERGNAARARLDTGGASDLERRRLRDEAIRGETARREMIEANLRLVVSVARHYAGRGLPLLDLIQEGNVGLGQAVDRFDWRRGFRFSTYATYWIRQGMVRALEEDGRIIRLPVHLLDQSRRVTQAARDLRHSLGREPSAEELARAAEISGERLAEILRTWPEPVSLETPVGEASELGDLIPDPHGDCPDRVVADRVQNEEVREALSELPARERRVIALRFGLDDGQERSLREVGAIVGLTRERARQIEASALRKLRTSGRIAPLREALC